MVHHFEDASLLAVFLYLRLYLRFDLNLAFKKLATGRVTGEVTGSDIEKALQLVADNSPVTHVLNQHILYPALILDDLGARRSSGFAEDVLFELIGERYSNMRPTLFTSNYSLQELADRIEARTVSRIAGMCAGHIYYLGGPDRRLTKGKNL